ncbi:endonuclease/exonuclease/phosphatase family protein [Tropicimonas sp. IMCC34011]|uniref:endonuclease/exonuclease/phosphatase family protein n=1 Tax=Tropicimonas sp. IMCC34011 TaxID=2248759 RepID=UPI000E25A028|nr:endonuclease/exonuclease/phosphatase family protein [Tropicimonas sp. IMCC34011]
MALIWTFVAGLGGLALAGSFLGALHPAGDSLAVFRLWIAGALALWLLLGTSLGLCRWTWLILPAVAILPVLWAYSAPEGGGERTIYQKNMLFRPKDLGPIEADIRSVGADIVMLQEVSDANQPILGALSDMLPSQTFCPGPSVGGVAVLSRWPKIEGTEVCASGVAAMRVRSPDGPLWIVSVHLSWPWPRAQAAQVRILEDRLRMLDGPVVMAGDFNMVRWSSAVRRLARASRTAPAGRARGSFRLVDTVPIAIDNVLIPKGEHGASELRGLFGSDHKGLVVRY